MEVIHECCSVSVVFHFCAQQKLRTRYRSKTLNNLGLILIDGSMFLEGKNSLRHTRNIYGNILAAELMKGQQ